jgi:metal-responsive CopG/Arc/MetJ family transcriptional regulator
MAEIILKRQKQLMQEFGIVMPKSTVERIDAVKGPYITRSKFILRAVDKALEEEEQKLPGATTIETRVHQVVEAAPTNPIDSGGGSRSSG